MPWQKSFRCDLNNTMCNADHYSSHRVWGLPGVAHWPAAQQGILGMEP